MTQNNCQHCAKEFTLVRKWQVFCSKSCAMKAKYIRDRANKKPKYNQYEADLWRFYKLSLNDFNLLSSSQGNSCKICKTPQKELVGKKTRLCVDHCHTTGKIRGLLCEKCNTMLGMAKDSILTLQSAIEYLQKA